MRFIPTLLATPCLLVSCVPEDNQSQVIGPNAPAPSALAAPPSAPLSLTDERMRTQGERIARLENELHEMRLLFTNQLKRIEEVANRPTSLSTTAYQHQAQPQQVVIMPNNPVVTHRWDEQAPRATAANHTRGYQVRAGDTLSQIAEAHGIPTQALMTANPGIDPLRLRIGKQLTIPSATQASQFAAQAQNANRAYTVRTGDTLSQVAEAHGLGLSELIAANPGLDARRLRIGARLTIPPSHHQRRSSQPAGYASPPLQTIQREPRIAPQSWQQEEQLYQPHYQSHRLPTQPEAPQPTKAATPTHKTLIRIPKGTSFGEIAENVGSDVETLNRLNHSALSATSRIPANGTLYVPSGPQQ